MRTVQIMMEEALLTELDGLARRKKLDRSKIVRAAVKRYLDAAEVEAWEEADVAAYRKKPLAQVEVKAWRKAQVWPKE